MSEPLHRRRAQARLKRRVDSFLSSKAEGRGEVAEFAAGLQELGRAVVIGGMLRDLSMAGPRTFRSDVDFVVDAGSLPAYRRFVARREGKPNRFGGHAIQLSRWKVEVWPLQLTWAAVEGHVPVERIDDLLGVTFFDWDAILYDVSSGRLIARETYFDGLLGRVIDLNLEPNPNPLGNAVRAFRYAYRWNARLGQRLASHVARQVADHGWQKLVAYERSTFADAYLAEVDGEKVASCLRAYSKGRGDALALPLAEPRRAL